MNKDINFTLSAFVPLLRMNGEKVVSVEAVEDWYEIDGHEYMKEVAEITYENGYRQYADIGCDANLTAVYDVIRVIQQVKPKSEKIERIVRDVYPKPDVPDTNVGNKAQLSDKGTTFENGGEIKRWSEDIISRQAAIRWVKTECNPYGKPTLDFESGKKFIEHLEQMPPAELKIIHCKDCKWFREWVDVDLEFCSLTESTVFCDDFCSKAAGRLHGSHCPSRVGAERE